MSYTGPSSNAAFRGPPYATSSGNSSAGRPPSGIRGSSDPNRQANRPSNWPPNPSGQAGGSNEIHNDNGIGSDEPSSNAFFDNFDVLDWHPHFKSCVRYFIDHAQYTGPVEALAALVNIQLPFQKAQAPILDSTQLEPPPPPRSQPQSQPQSQSQSQPAAILPQRDAVLEAAPGVAPSRGAGQPGTGTYPFATLTPYIRRLVATGFDYPKVLHGFFGDDWEQGVGPLHEMERRNFMFAAKSANWLTVKKNYDMAEDQSVPCLLPLRNPSEQEIVTAERMWSEWLAMQDWMVGPRDPENHQDIMVKDEEET